MIYSTVRPEEITVTSKYERLAEAIREQIRTGQLSAGDKLPSTAQLQEQYGVSYGSVRSAMLVLKAEGLVEGRPGEGVYVRHRGE